MISTLFTSSKTLIYQLGLLGYTSANQRLFRIIHCKGQQLHDQLGIQLSVTAISDPFYGTVCESQGLQYSQIETALQNHGSFSDLPNANPTMDHYRLLDSGCVDLVCDPHLPMVDGTPKSDDDLYCYAQAQGKTMLSPHALYQTLTGVLQQSQSVLLTY